MYKDYSILIANAKFGQQYIELFKILDRVNKQAYRLDILSHWRIHSIFSLTQLKSSLEPNPFKRPISNYPESVFIKGDTSEARSYEVKRLLNKRVRRRGKGESVEYLVRWRGYDPEFDTWYNVKDLDHSMDLIQEYEEEMISRQASKAISPATTLRQASKAITSKATTSSPQEASAELARIESQATESATSKPTTPKPSTEHAVAVVVPPLTIPAPQSRLAIEPP